MRSLSRPKEKRTPNSDAKSAFGDRSNPLREISTNLYDCVPLADATKYGDVRAKDAGAREIRGWLVIPGEVGRRNGRSVNRTPLPENPYHADIVLPEAHAETWEDAEVHLREFLSSGEWQGRAPSTVARPPRRVS